MATRCIPQADHLRPTTDRRLACGDAASGWDGNQTIRPRTFRCGSIVAGLFGLSVVLLVGWSGWESGLRANEPAGEPAVDQENRKAESPGDTGPPGDTGRPDDYPLRSPTNGEAPKKLSSAELKVLAAQGRVRKLVDQKFRRQPRAKNRFERVKPDDYFVAAKFEVPLAVGRLDVRFEILPGLEPSVEQVSEYLLTTPQQAVRDFMVVARFETLAEAEDGLAAVRKQYDDARAYQQQLMAYLQAQQKVQVSSMRRC